MAKHRNQDRHKPSRNIRIPLALYDELEALADRNERPIHWEARLAIREHIKRENARAAEDAATDSPDAD